MKSVSAPRLGATLGVLVTIVLTLWLLVTPSTAHSDGSSLGALTRLCVYVPGACVPVVVAALYMEHRARTSAPIPIAIARAR